SEGDNATEASAEQAPALQLQAGFVPNGGTAKVVYIDMDKIDLDDDEDKPLQEVVGLSQSIESLGLLELPVGLSQSIGNGPSGQEPPRSRSRRSWRWTTSALS